jgi:hypothetical protein
MRQTFTGFLWHIYTLALYSISNLRHCGEPLDICSLKQSNVI